MKNPLNVPSVQGVFYLSESVANRLKKGNGRRKRASTRTPR